MFQNIQKNILECIDLSIWDLIKVAYQIGGKIVIYSINGLGSLFGDKKLYTML